MVKYNATPQLDATFAALSDPTRRALLARLCRGSATVGELANPFAMSLPAVSKHLRVLEDAGLVRRRRDGRIHHIGLEPRPLAAAADWIDHYSRFWEERFDALTEYLREQGEKESPTWPRKRLAPNTRSRSSAPSRPRRKPSSRPGRKPRR